MSDAYTPPPNGFRTFVIVWLTQSVSAFGSALTYFGINIWLVQGLYPLPEQKPELAAALSAVSLFFAIPIVVFAPLAGAWADRHDRKRTMLVLDFVNGLVSLLLMYLLFTNQLQLWSILVIIAVMATTSAFHGSAFDTSYAMLVKTEQLPRANGMMQTMWSLSGILSPGIAAAIIAVPALFRQSGRPSIFLSTLAGLKDGTPLLMGVDALTFFIASATLLFVFIPSPKRTDLEQRASGEKKSIWADIKEGGVYIWHRRPLLWLLGTFAVANFAVGPLGIFYPLLVKFNLAADWTLRGFTYESALATLSTIGSVGGVVGGLIISSWGGLRRRRVMGVIVPLILSGLAMVVLGISDSLFLVAAMSALQNGLIPMMNSHSQSIWQAQTPHELQGRVFAVRRVIAQFSWPLSTAMAGVLGGLFDPGAVVSVLGLILAVFCVFQLFNPALLKVEDHEHLEALAANYETTIVSE